ncbi:hypothetical protein MTR67_034535 [Solanum verrucosum]|uniref:Uncharacterized protein n=1 Tax=Solanum verrucosum TaxID=315347 RepID=A0AAF0ZKI5_SOLVR|nr:hypothetical protein MTR67_034535 [Solanum verrucosum]
MLMAKGREAKQASPSELDHNAPKYVRFYALRSRKDKEGSTDEGTGPTSRGWVHALWSGIVVQGTRLGSVDPTHAPSLWVVDQSTPRKVHEGLHRECTLPRAVVPHVDLCLLAGRAKGRVHEGYHEPWKLPRVVVPSMNFPLPMWLRYSSREALHRQ